MADVALAFVWHQHQPYYPDDVARDNPMPWVRLHGVKDYYGMALHLLEFPEMRCTINLVPSLLVQLRAYYENNASDQLLDVSRIPSADLTLEQACFLLENFFMANHNYMIRPFPRYFELLQRRDQGKTLSRDVARRFQDRDLRDLQVWFNLSWIHPLAVAEDPNLTELVSKGKHFTEEDKKYVLDKHLTILKQILPLHRKLVESGQVELTTTPFYHPILPLLLDKRTTREAMPDARLPRHLAPYPDDAQWHVQNAVRYHAQVFGTPPVGMWPAEGSVCQQMIPILAKEGVQWIATDEEILTHSTNGLVGRDPRGFVRNPEQMYQPYRVAAGEHQLSIIFRDHALSDLIGFHYQRSDGAPAADDLLGKVRSIGHSIQGSGPCLVSVILDGENCWEHYPGGGVDFLRALYERCVRTPGVQPVRVADYLSAHPPRNTLPHLFAGSWISHNFDIWIGHEEDNTGWDLLHITREHLKLRQSQGVIPAERIERAWTELHIAEGSDWFWWYGPHHSSAQDQLFDYLFRKHLQNVFAILGEPAPGELSKPIGRRVSKAVHTDPKSFLDVRIDGRRMPIEWMGAGHYTAQNERGTMAMVSKTPIRDVYFGFTPSKLLIRVDFEENAGKVLGGYDALRYRFIEPGDYVLEIFAPCRAECQTRLLFQGEPVHSAGIEFGIEKVAEVAIPFELLKVTIGQVLRFYVELMEGNQSRDRAPRDAAISVVCPSPDFERIMWDV